MSGVKKPRTGAPPKGRPGARPAARPMVQDRPSRWQMLMRRQRRMLTRAAAGLTLLGLGIGGLAAAHAIGHGQSFEERLGDATGTLGLRVDQVVIEGRQKTPEPLLRAALGIHNGDAILGFSLQAARARIESIQWVQSATVSRRLPGTVVVQLKERSPFAVWQHDGKFVLIDRDGQIVTDSDFGSFASQLPLVVGAGAPQAAAALIDALAAQPTIQSRVSAAVRVGERRWNLRLNNGTDVLLPEGAEALALARLVELQSAHALLDRPLQAVDMRLPDRFVFRPQSPRGDGKDTAPAPQTRKPT